MRKSSTHTGPLCPTFQHLTTDRREKNDVADSSVRLCKKQSSFFNGKAFLLCQSFRYNKPAARRTAEAVSLG